jgi:fermentation-respiration switch protein FrsA (DUF1100 family)
MLGAGAALGLLGAWYANRDPVRVIDARAGRLAAADTLAYGAVGSPPATVITEVELRGSRGLRFRARVTRPAHTAGRLPGLLLLAGVETGRDAVSLVGATHPAVHMAIDYPYDAPMRMDTKALLADVPSLRAALYDAAAASLLAADYLAQSSLIHPDSLFIVGTSFGAFFGPIATVAREEVDALVLIQGGGGLRRLIDANLRWAGVEAFVPLLATAGAVLLHPFEPLRCIGRVAPRPVYLVNGRGDDRIPEACVDALYDAAREPKELLWIDAPHVHPTDAALIGRLTRAVSSLLFARPPGAGAE